MLSSEENHSEVSSLLSEGAVTEVVLQSMAWKTIRAVWIGRKSRSHIHNFTITVMKRYQHQQIKTAKKNKGIHENFQRINFKCSINFVTEIVSYMQGYSCYSACILINDIVFISTWIFTLLGFGKIVFSTACSFKVA